MLFATSLLMTLATAHAPTPPPVPAACPDVALGETELDCPWAQVAREWDARNPDFLKVRLPELATQIATDAALESWKGLWGTSINYDELAQGLIVEPAILKDLARGFKLDPSVFDRKDPAGHLLAHAGLTHTYGYLFSNLKTPFGYKRARWVEAETSEGFGLSIDDERLSPGTQHGTLFANVTYVAGRIAFRHEPRELAALEAGKAAVAREIPHLAYDRFRITRLEEVIAERQVTLRTDLVAFPSGGVKNFFWLVYSIKYADRAELITAFPVNEAFVQTVTNPAFLGENQAIKTRYNAYVEDASGPISGQDWKGTRRLEP